MAKSPSLLHDRLNVVVALIKNAEGHFLVAKRLPHQDEGGKWEFPGGKIDPGECADDALVRELDEEVDITPTSFEYFDTVLHDYPQYNVALHLYWVRVFEGEPVGKEGQEIDWVAAQHLPDLSFPYANYEILRRMQEFT